MLFKFIIQIFLKLSPSDGTISQTSSQNQNIHLQKHLVEMFSFASENVSHLLRPQQIKIDPVDFCPSKISSPHQLGFLKLAEMDFCSKISLHLCVASRSNWPKCRRDFSARSYLVCVWLLAVITATAATTCFPLSLSRAMISVSNAVQLLSDPCRVKLNLKHKETQLTANSFS